MQTPGVLDGIRILDVSQGAAGPTAGMVLGEYGANVIKVDPPQGEWGRRLGPPFLGEDAAAYIGMNRNKRSIVINLKTERGLDVFKTLAARSDVVLESFRPGVMDRLGIGYAGLSHHHPDLIYCAISAFGTTGPWRDKPGVDGIIQAMSGLMSVTGEPDGQPVKVGVPAADMTAALIAVQGILLALLARMTTGKGQRIDVSLLQSLFFFQTVPWSMFMVSGRSPGRQGSAAPYSAPNEVYPTKDGFLMVAAYWPQRWTKLTQLLECEELAADPRFCGISERVIHRAELFDLLAEKFRRRNTEEWLDILGKEDILCAPVMDYDQLAKLAHVMTPENFPRLEHPDLGMTPGVGMPTQLQDMPSEPRRPAPLTGEHTREILEEGGYSAGAIDELIEQGAVGERSRILAKDLEE